MVEPAASTDVPTNTEQSEILDVNSQLEEHSAEDALQTAPMDREKEIQAFDNNLPKTVTLLRGDGGSKLYLVGTAHFSVESQNDVSTVIQNVRPNIVVVELCKSRSLILQMDDETIKEEAKNLTTQKMIQTMKDYGVLQGLMYILLLNLSSQLTKDLGMAPGGEFRRAFQEVKKIPGCFLSFGDRPIQVTLKRVLNVLSWWNRIRLAYSLLFTKQNISHEDIEKYKESDLLESILEEMIKDFPELGNVFVNERDIFLTYSLQLATQHPFINTEGKQVPATVVGVVGIGHTPGIKRMWGKVFSSDIPSIMDVTPPVQTGVRWGRCFLAGAALVAAYQLAKRPFFAPIRLSITNIFSSV